MVFGKRIQVNQVEKKPADVYIWKIKAPPGTLLGLLSVDESVYLLRNDNRLTKERVRTSLSIRWLINGKSAGTYDFIFTANCI